jgi:hypothetical protein
VWIVSQPNNGDLGDRLIHQLSYVGIADILRNSAVAYNYSGHGRT